MRVWGRAIGSLAQHILLEICSKRIESFTNCCVCVCVCVCDLKGVEYKKNFDTAFQVVFKGRERIKHTHQISLRFP